MLKRVLILSIIALVIAAAGYIMYLSDTLRKSSPELMDMAKLFYEDSCREEPDCLRAVNEHFGQCQLDNYIQKAHLLNFQDKYFQFLVNTHACIRTKAGVDLPSIMDYMAQERLSEIESS